MKILVLMPCDEKSVHMAAGIYNALPQEIREKTFPMPWFMDWVVQTNLERNWLSSLFRAFVAAKKIYEKTTDDEDLIIIGNMDKDFKFDAVFNFQDIEESLPYEDKFIDKIKKIVINEDVLYKYVKNLYGNEDSKMALQNCIATADFLTAYLKTDGIEKKIKKLNKEYKKKLGSDLIGFSTC